MGYTLDRAPSNGFAGIITPDQMLDQAKAVDADFVRLNASIANSPSVDPAFAASWLAFFKEWRDFLASLSGVSGYAKRLWAGTADQIDAYASKLVGWQSDLTANGGSVIGPQIEKPVAPPTLEGTLSKVAWIAGLVVVGIVVFKVVPKRRK